jgi:hypothetical protein
VDPGPAVTIADGATASRGDLIIATRNDHHVEAGEPGRALANGDLLRIDAVTEAGLLVRRALDTDRQTGQRRWTDRQFLYANYRDAELGYAVTDHVAQGRTVHTGLAVITGTEDRQHAYVALTRGTHDNTAYVFTQPPKQADPAPGPRPAPELARYDALTTRAADPSPANPAAGTDDALAVLAEVISRDGQLLSASQTWQQDLADADHLAILHAIWAAETTPAREQRYRDLLTAALPPLYQQEPTHQAKWLWRTLHAAELAGLNARQVLADAVSERDLNGARDVAAVIDARIRRRTGTLLPLPAPPWSARPPAVTDPKRRAYAGQIAELMDARKERIGEHAAASSLPWAVSALGPVPADPLPRLDWQRRAASIGAYRELSGYNHPADPIGPEPATSNPELRAAWYQALAALGLTDGQDLRGMAGGLLIHLRDTYPVETAWAPPWVGDQLRQARAGSRDARLAALRATAEAGTARRQGDHEQATRQQALAASYQALDSTYQRHEAALTTTMADRAAWERATRQQRQLAVAADAELRRRHPGQRWPALRSAEPQLPAQAQSGDLVPIPRPEGETAQWIADLAAQHRDFTARLAERHKMTPSAEDSGPAEREQVVLAWAEPQGDAILQSPRPQIQPSERVLERVSGRDLNMELAD